MEATRPSNAVSGEVDHGGDAGYSDLPITNRRSLVWRPCVSAGEANCQEFGIAVIHLSNTFSRN
jgi:hypothetical protein